MTNVLNLLAQTKIDADKALEQAAQYDSLTYVLVLFMILGFILFGGMGGVVLKWGILPWVQARVKREDKEADIRNAAMTKVGDATEVIANCITRHDERFDAHDKRFDHLDKAVVAVHERLDRWYGPRRHDEPSQPPLPRA